jgi:ubiquinone/menaquinone biosynthesis C-methylase UbiE
MPRADTQAHFNDAAARYYDRNYTSPTSRHERALALRREVCLELLGDTSGRVLDLGCGPGALAVPLAKQGRAVVAFDLAPAMVTEARRLIGADTPACGFVVGDATALPFAAATFDTVVTTGVLEYVADIDHAIAEIARVLRPGGCLVATASLPRRLERAVARYAGRFVLALKRKSPDSPAMFHRAFTPAEFDRAIRGCGLTIEARRFSCFAPFPLDAVYPPFVTTIDHVLGAWLAQVPLATERAKTYIVKARRA